jgi:hypothetical protein
MCLTCWTDEISQELICNKLACSAKLVSLNVGTLACWVFLFFVWNVLIAALTKVHFVSLETVDTTHVKAFTAWKWRKIIREFFFFLLLNL